MRPKEPAHQTKTYRGVEYTIGPRTPFPGIGWKIKQYDHLGRELSPIETCGACYDGCDDHPEGAYAWADECARDYIDDMLAGRLSAMDRLRAEMFETPEEKQARKEREKSLDRWFAANRP